MNLKIKFELEETELKGEIENLIPSSSGGSLPSGGTTGQVLTKNSNADGDAGWKEPYTYVLPAATAQTLGGVKIGNGISIAEDGTISSEGSGSASAVLYTEQTLTDEQKTQALANIGGLSKNQGTKNSGKFLGIGADGIVIPTDSPATAFSDDGSGNISVNRASANAKRFLNSLTVPGLDYKYVNPINSGTYASPYGVYISSGTIIDYVVGLTQVGFYTAYVNRKVTDIPDAAKAANSSLRGFVCVSQIDNTASGGSTKCYAYIVLIDQNSNFYIQYIQSSIGGGWKRMYPYETAESALMEKLDKNQGTANSGKFLGIGADGVVVPTEVGGSGNIEVLTGMELIVDHTVTEDENDSVSLVFTNDVYPLINNNKLLLILIERPEAAGSSWVEVRAGTQLVASTSNSGAWKWAAFVGDSTSGLWLNNWKTANSNTAQYLNLAGGLHFGDRSVTGTAKYEPYNKISIGSYTAWFKTGMTIKIWGSKIT